MRKLLTLLFICLLGSFAGVALGQTPDGDPPAVETICNDLNFSGSAFGLCNAYCEAMDCDCPTNGDLNNPDCLPKASQKACDRVLGNFYNRRPDVILLCSVDDPKFFSLAIEVFGEGLVESDIMGEGGSIISCQDPPQMGDVCSETFAENTVVELTATAALGWSFLTWGLDCASFGSTNPITVTMDMNYACEAEFELDL